MLASTLPYELRIGVTGHRELADHAGVERAVSALLAHVQRVLESGSAEPRGEAGAPQSRFDRFLLAPATRVLASLPKWGDLPIAPRHTPAASRAPVEWIAISPLARGADRCVARAVLALPGGRLQVVMPFAVDDYRRDFADAADRAEFEELFARRDAQVELPSPVAPGGTPRNEGYLRAGQHVVDACELLIAVWDGEPASGRGGTGDVVAYALERGRKVLWIDARNPGAPAKRLLRLEGGRPHATAPVPSRLVELSPGYHEHAAYFRTPDRWADDVRQTERAAQKRAALAALASAAGLSAAWTERWLLDFRPHYERADRLAALYQTLYERAALWLYGLSSLAVTLVTIQVVLWHDALWLIALELLAIAVIPVLLQVGKREGFHRKWLDNRHLAERLRAAMFVALTDAPHGAAAPTLPFYEGPSGWMDALVDRLLREHRRTRQAPLALDAQRHLVVEGWLREQASWQERNAQTKHAVGRSMHGAGLLLYGLTAAMAVIHLFGHPLGFDHDTWQAGLVSVLAIALPAWGASIHAFATLRDYERIGERSEQMHRVLAGLAGRAASAQTQTELDAVVAEAAALMGAEVHEWAISLRFRGLELPA